MAVVTHIKTDPVGIDIKIQNLQERFEKVTTPLWSLTDADFFGRVYLDEDENFIVPSGFKSGREYRDVLFNDTKQVTSFFYVKDEEPIGVNLYKATIGHIWQFKPDKLKSSVTHVADEEVLQDILNVYKDEPFSFAVQNIFRTASEVYADFNLKTRFINKRDRSSLRIDSEVIYKYSNC